MGPFDVRAGVQGVGGWARAGLRVGGGASRL